MARCSARPAAASVGCALVLVLSTANAAEPHASKGPTARSGPAEHSASGRVADTGSRRRIAGGPTVDDAFTGVETPELRALREAERDLFPPAAPSPGNPWPSDLPLLVPGERPLVLSSGLPPAAPPMAPLSAEGGKDLSWLARLELPDLPIRWDERVVRYIEYFRDDPRGHSTLVTLYRRSGRWRDMIRRTLRRKSLPEDLVWVSMMESGFDAAAHSVKGAAGLWQFMPESAKLYGLTIDRWVDQRYDSTQSTEAAADFLGDLHRRFGSWELALAAFNMGYGGLSSVVHRYNSNDFWALAHMEGTLPWETTVYVPRILAAAVAAHNPAVFGLSDVVVDPPVEFDEVSASPGTPLALVAQAAGCLPKAVEALNPELRASRTPPVSESDAAYSVKVPPGKGSAAAQGLSRWHRDQGSFERYVVRFGETVEQIAAAHHTTAQKLIELNAIAPGEAIRGGTVLLVPKGPVADATPPATSAKPNVVVPAALFEYPDRKRVFYRVLVADTLREIATALHVTQEDLCRWNDVDPGGRLQEGMTLQAFVPSDADLSHVAVLTEVDVHVLPIGSDEFFTALEHDRGFKRVTVTAQAGDTIQSIGQRFGVPARTMERINRRSRREAVAPGEAVVVYVPNGTAAPRSSGVTAVNEPSSNGPLPVAPEPDWLP